MVNLYKSFTKELRRIRWSNLKKSTQTFVYTMSTVIVIGGCIVLFSWGMTSLISLMQG